MFIFLSFLAFVIGSGDIAHADVTCTGIQYYDSDSGSCVDCPEGFRDNETDGKTSINECQAQCAAGEKLLSGYETLEYLEGSGTQYIDTGYVVQSGTVSGSVGISSGTKKTGNVGNFAGNQGIGKGYAVNYKNGYFGLWIGKNTDSGQGNKATVSSASIAANTLYNLEYTIRNDSSRTFSVNGTNAQSNPAIGSDQSIQSVATYKVFTNGCHYSGTLPTGETSCGTGSNVPVSLRIHYVKLYDNDVLKLDLVPARRKSDGTLGMLDKVSGQFFTNEGTGTFTTNTNYTSTDIAVCIPVGTGRYNGVTVTNYGSLGTYNECPAGTYNNTMNATSAAACLPCSGATYNDETAQAACKACPTGYTDSATTGKTDVNQCQISCPAGTWNAAYTRLEYLESGGHQYINTGYTYSDETKAKVIIDTSFNSWTNAIHGGYSVGNYSGPRVGVNGSGKFYYSFNNGVSYDTDATLGTRYLFTLDAPNTTFTVKDVANDTFMVNDDDIAITVKSVHYGMQLFASNGGNVGSSRIYSAKIYDDGVLVRDYIPVRRNSDGVLGMYDLVSGILYTNAGTGTFHAGPDIAGSISTDSCTGVGVGYWSNAQMVNYGSVGTRTACPAGTSATNGTSAASCTDCTGATYSTGGTACLSCPVDFDYNTITSGKTTPTQCQAQCAAGTYYNGYTRLEYLESTGVQAIRANWGVSSAEIGTEKIVIDTTFLSSSRATHGRGLNTTKLGPGVGIKNGKLYLAHGTIDGVGNEFISDVTGNIGTRYLFTWDAPNTTFNVRDVENDTTVLNITDVAASNGTDSSVTVFLFGAGFGNANQVYRNTSRIYSAKFYKNDELQRDYVPVRRDSDGELGLYDLVNDVFYENFTTDNNTEPFIAGPEVTACWDAQPGYYAVSAVTNYGTAGSRSACPIGTYNNTDNGTSLSSCLSCAGATYNDETAQSACKSCPYGFTYNTTAGKTSANQCQVQCAAGTWNTGYKRLEYVQVGGSSGAYKINTGLYTSGGDMDVSATFMPLAFPGTLQNSKIFGADRCDNNNFCAIYGGTDGLMKMIGNPDTSETTLTLNTQTIFSGTMSATNAGTLYVDGVSTGLSATADSNQQLVLFGGGNGIHNIYGRLYDFTVTRNNATIMHLVPAERETDGTIGLYDTVTDTFFVSASTGTFIGGPEVAVCWDALPGYYAASAVTNYGQTGSRTACPIGTYNNTDNGTSLSSCLDCTGATYNDETAQVSCKSCPVGYTTNTTAGKTAENQCQLQCPNGKYNTGYSRVEYLQSSGAAYINTDYAFLNYSTPKIILDMASPASSNTYVYGIYAGNVASTSSLGPGFSVSANFGLTTGSEKIDTGVAATANTRYLFTYDAQNGTFNVKDVDSDTILVNQTNITTNSSGYSNAKYVLFGNHDGSNYYTRSGARVYSAKIYDNGVLVRDYVPVRRNSDGVLGMYDLANNVFYTNSNSSGSFIAGADVGGVCVDAGVGHWTAPVAINFGSAGTNNACPIGTSTTNGTSASSCTDCAGATYNDVAGGACRTCPTGYTSNTTAGKTSESQCQISCSAGTWNGEYTKLEYLKTDGNAYINTGYAPTSENQRGLLGYGLNERKDIIGNRNSHSGYTIWEENPNIRPILGHRKGGNLDMSSDSYISNSSYAPPYNLEYVLSPNSRTLTRDGIYTATGTNFGNSASGENMYLFRAGVNETSGTTKGQIYYYKLYDNGVLVLDMIPVRRNSDGVLGMINKVTGAFLTNAGTGAFIAGPDDGVFSGQCVDAGAGYWAGAAVSGYGLTPSRNACPIGTYNDTTNGTSVAACVDCAGATYNDETAQAACKTCPSGYDYNTTSGKTKISQCQAHCDAGQYIPTEGNVYTPVEYIESDGSSYINTGFQPDADGYKHTIVFEATSSTQGYVCGTGTNGRSGNVRISNYAINGIYNGTSSALSIVTGTKTILKAPNTLVLDLKNNAVCSAVLNGTTISNDTTTTVTSGSKLTLFGSAGTSSATFKIYSDTIEKNGEIIHNFIPVKRNSDNEYGMFDTVTGQFFTNAGTGTFTGGNATGDSFGGAQCTNVGTGYYAPASTLNYGATGSKNACPIGTYSGIETGASLSDCLACPAATYNGSTAAASCTACPAGYDYGNTTGKTTINQCQIQCSAGTYVSGGPSEFTVLDYIETSGTQYIDTGMVPANLTNPIMELTLAYTNTNATQQSGAFDSVNHFKVGISGSGNAFLCQAAGNNTDTVFTTPPDTNKHTFVLNAGAGTCSFDNETNALTSVEYSTIPVYIGTVNTNGVPDTDRFSSARYYNFKMTSGGNVVMNLVPARRNSDNVLGMYDTVTGQFFTNSGTGTFTGGNATGDSFGGAQCENVGTGYYAGSSIINYGSTGTKSACPIGTYSAIETAGSVSDCLSCPGGTYNGSTAAAACTACPAGYDYNGATGNTSINQCQIQCPGGTYVGGPVGSNYTQLEYIESVATSSTASTYINTGYVVQEDDEIEIEYEITRPTAATYQTICGTKNTASTDPLVWVFNYYNSSNSIYRWYSRFGSTAAKNATFTPSSESKGTLVLKKGSLSINGASRGAPVFSSMPEQPLLLFATLNSSGTVHRPSYGLRISEVRIKNNGDTVHKWVACKNSSNQVGMCDVVGGEFLANAGSSNFVAGPELGQFGTCSDVGAGYYAASSITNYGQSGARNMCPVGTYTVGYGHGADEANDCGRILHLGDSVIYARKNKPTTPALNIRMENGDMYYIGLSTTDHEVSRLHFQTGETKYTAFDDSLFYGERDYDTGEQITQ